ncbi:Methylamine utilisation protein MauE [Singulisphaera sp. GP187]|uniref:MauE/DoxX family redox-associated membrane protein n=1 Tax=Singulisphaera sp. GP187 TaxID=1882752 RepID=UPI00092C671F|nr:MauE/DoxX family redox-associated membrane protein [Singulisphaera sp. GP187]SIO10123.1 Methylamine utilisation protein MauE [Singulisphaera sp. GP187]
MSDFSAVRTGLVRGEFSLLTTDGISALASILRVALGGVLLVSSFWKLYQPYEFLTVIYDYDLVGAYLGLFMAILLPWFELALGLALMMNIMERGALLLGSMLLGVFTTVQAISLWRGLNITCGCFGSQGEPIGYRGLTFGVLAFTASLFLVLRSHCQPHIDAN